MADIPPAPPSQCQAAISVPMPMPKTKHSVASLFAPRAQLPSDDSLSFPNYSLHQLAAAHWRVLVCYVGCFVPFADVSAGFTQKRTSWV